MDKLAIIIPVFNEEEVLQKSIDKFLNLYDLLTKEKLINKNSKIIFIDDGSQDRTWTILSSFVKKFDQIKAIKLSRNFGQQNAILAGLFTIDADMYITVEVMK